MSKLKTNQQKPLTKSNPSNTHSTPISDNHLEAQETQIDFAAPQVTSGNVLHLQRMIGNRQTIQYLQRRQQKKTPDESSTNTEQAPVPIAPTAQGDVAIQRLMSERALLMNAGDPDKDSILNNIMTAVAEYHEATKDGAGVQTLTSYLGIIISFAEKWLNANPVENGHDGDKARTAKLIPNLLNGAKREKESLEKGDQKTIDKSDKMLINKQDIQYEMLAHYVAYKGTGGAMGELLHKWGFESTWRRSVQGNGFFVGLLMPQTGRNDVTPVLTFKGTTPSSTGDISADLDPVGVGFTAFQRHKSDVASLIDEAGGTVDVVGHSLGGALAQHCGFSFNSNVRRVVTYQSAAISGTQALMLRAMKKQPEATHHVAKNDAVPTGGLGHLKGQGFLHDPGKGIAAAHTTYLFTAPEFREDREKFGLTDEVLAQLGLDKHIREETHAPVKHTKGHPTSMLKKLGGEFGRNLGMAIAGIPLFLISLFQKYPSIAMQDSTVKNNAKHAAMEVFKDYQKSATKKRFLGLGKAKGITVSGIEDAVKTIMKKDPAYAKFAGAAEGIKEAAIEVLGIQDIQIQGGKVVSVSL